MSVNEIPKSRKSYLFKMAAKIAVQQGKKYLQAHPDSRFKTLLSQAEILVDHVGKLKGAAMKAVQTLSVEGYDFFPPEVMQVLEKLQSQAPPVSSEILINQIRNELGEENFTQLESLSQEPLASASIGQVYRAQYKGRAVVVKVQYPGVAESVDDDIATLNKLLKGLLLVSGKKIDFDDLMAEAHRVLKLETNYLNEMASLKRYKELFSGSDYLIPEVFPEMCTGKVLVMSFEQGLEYTDWLKTSPPEILKQKVADQLLSLYNKEFFENRLVQTDPNPANFLVQADGQIVLLDFGATIEFETDFVRQYQQLVRKVFSRDRAEILQMVFTMNFLDPKEASEVQEAFVDFLLLSMTPFDENLQPFDFGDSEYSQQVRTEAMRFSRMLKYSAPPKKLIFLHRKLGGIFMLLKKLDVKADITPYRKLMLEKDFF